MKIAILHYGQPRYAVHPELVENRYQFLLNKYNPNIYGHMWSKQQKYIQGTKWNTPYQFKYQKEMYVENVENKFEEIYNPISIMHQKQKAQRYYFNQFNGNIQTKLFNIFPRQTADRFTIEKRIFYINNLFLQFHSIQFAARHFLQKKIKDYDYVILMRYDLIFNKQFNLQQNKFKIQHQDIWQGKRVIGCQMNKYSYRDNLIVYRQDHIKLFLSNILDMFIENIQKYFSYCQRLDPQAVHGFIYSLIFEDIQQNVQSLNYPHGTHWGIKGVTC